MPFQPLIRRYPSCITHLVSLIYLLVIATIVWFALSMGQNVHEARFGHGPVSYQVHGLHTGSSRIVHHQVRHTELTSCPASSNSSVYPNASATSSVPVSATPSISTTRRTSKFMSTLDTRFTTLAKPISSNIEALPGFTVPIISGIGVAARNDSQLPTPTPTFAAAPAESTDVKQPPKVSRKWKTVALTLGAILAAMFALGLSVCLGCGWFVGELMDDH